MGVPMDPASKWPARAAFAAAGIFVGASGTINVVYGWSKGTDLVSSATWATVAAAVAIVFALSWPALIRSVEMRRWSAALVALVALALAGSYSVTAALGSTAGARANAANAEVATTDARQRAQDAYEAAKAELAGLRTARPVAELEALVASAHPRCRIVVQLGRRDTVCTPPAALVAELGRAERRSELDAVLAKASGELARIGPAKVANSDAKALARYLAALGFDIGPDRLNDLLVLLAVLMIEAGGGLSLALGMALSAPTVIHAERRTSNSLAGEHEQSVTVFETPLSKANSLSLGSGPPVQPPAPAVHAPTILDLLHARGGSLRTTTRRLGAEVGRPPATVHTELRRLAASGLITLDADRRGTHIALRAKPN